MRGRLIHDHCSALAARRAVLIAGLIGAAALAAIALASSPALTQPAAAITLSEFVFTAAPFRQCHASTLAELRSGVLLAAWFGGNREGDPSVAIWGARRDRGGWSKPFELARERGVPCWNPVLFVDRTGKIWLFYKYGIHPRSWAGAYRTSIDGFNWSPATHLPAGVLGPAKNKPITLADGGILAGTSVETLLWLTSWVDLSTDAGHSWRVLGPIALPWFRHGVIQPTLWEAAPGHVKMLMRSSLGRICEAHSDDDGRTWSAAQPTDLPNPNSGIDAVLMNDHTVALAYNDSASARTPLSIAFSRDNGVTWSKPFNLESGPGEYSYPAIIQTADGLLHVTYTWKRQRIKHVVINPRALGY